MMQVWKSYQVFLSGVWERWIMYLIYPVLFLWLNYWGLVKVDLIPGVWLMMCCGMIVSLEIFWDYFVFGGIGAKDTNKLEYLKTSPKGLQILQKSLIGDWIRRVVCIAVIILSSGIIIDTGFEWKNLGVCVPSTIFLIELGLTVNRNFSHWGVVITAVMILGMAAMILTGLVWENGALGIICGILGLVLSVAGRILIMRRARRSYYDGRD